MKIRNLFLLLALCFNTCWSDFSDTQIWLHPLFPSLNPYIIEMTGEWPSDCHPGEQKPLIREYTGDSVLIEFEIITDHITCNEVATPYRVLVDISDVIEDVEGNFGEIEITVRFDGAESKNVFLLTCNVCSPSPPGPHIKPEAGLYFNEEMDKQGLILARQNDRMGVYPLIYDESGSSEWLIGGGGIVEDVFFAELVEFTGGQCLGCLPPAESPQVGVVGKISMLMDSEGLIQVKVNDGLFVEYKPLVFGYGDLDISGSLINASSPDLSGRWAFSKVGFDDVVATLPSAPILPFVFDIVLKWAGLEPGTPVPPDVTTVPVQPSSAMFSIRDIDGEEVAEMFCGFVVDNFVVDEMVCHVSNPGINEGDTLFAVKLLSLERLSFDWVGPTIPEFGRNTGIAVRID